ncbi:hypothetical protein PFISCL1PPCAC_18488, partial [Pristionchus fissidentatus]
ALSSPFVSTLLHGTFVECTQEWINLPIVADACSLMKTLELNQQLRWTLHSDHYVYSELLSSDQSVEILLMADAFGLVYLLPKMAAHAVKWVEWNLKLTHHSLDHILAICEASRTYAPM